MVLSLASESDLCLNGGLTKPTPGMKAYWPEPEPAGWLGAEAKGTRGGGGGSSRSSLSLTWPSSRFSLVRAGLEGERGTGARRSAVASLDGGGGKVRSGTEGARYQATPSSMAAVQCKAV